eukprot:TRINITY_DN5943_c0_g1_i1.p1 TRINITY_DN5943_c0_g1~~TRINITY_DN5943_c0_g1_i1.p1  ORF type:complete len:2529 (-),score=855.67 TRINITY_DN5943_c0_g1_i1:42-7628(-)
MSDEDLIWALLQRIYVYNGQYRVHQGARLTPEQAQQQKISSEAEEAVIKLAHTKLSVIADALVEKLKNVVPEELQIQLMDILARILEVEWYNIDPNHNATIDPKTVQSIMEKHPIPAAEIRTTSLGDSLAQKILTLVQTTLLKLPVSKTDEMTPLESVAGKVLHNLSGVKPDLVIPKITAIISTGVDAKDNDETANQYMMIQHLDLNQKRLSDLLFKVNSVIPAYAKKATQQTLIAKALRIAIWNWIDNHTLEYVQLCVSGAPIHGNPDLLFDAVDVWSASGKASAKKDFWPLQTTLLILSPETLIAALEMKKDKSDPSIAKKEAFVENLKKTLKSGKNSDVAAICYVDITKASTCMPKEVMSALRFATSAFEIDLNDKVFDPEKPIRRSNDNEIDIGLMIEWFVSLFRNWPQKVCSTHLPAFLKPEAPPLFRQVLLKGILRIAKGTKLYWNPTIDDAYSSLSASLRGLFSELVKSATQYDQMTRDEKGESKRSKEKDKLLFDISILEDTITSFIEDPFLPLFPADSVSQNLDATKNLLTGLCVCVACFGVPRLSDMAASALLNFHKPEFIERWCVKNVINGFWEISSIVNVTLADVLIERQDLTSADALKMITILEEILIRRNEFLRAHPQDGTKATDAKTLASTRLEIVFLMYLCSSVPNISSKASSCFGLICEELDILGTTDTANVILVNYPVYKKLASSGILSTGRVAQQLAIRRLLRTVERQTPGNFGAWQQVYDRWDKLTKTVLTYEEEQDIPATNPTLGLRKQTSRKEIDPLTKQAQDKIKDDTREEWKNYTGFLVALSGVCLHQEQVIKAPDKLKGKKEVEQTVKIIESFIDQLLDYLVSDNKYVRETVMAVTGTTTTHIVYPVLIRRIYLATRKFFANDKPSQVNVTKQSTLFIDQSISLVRHILELGQHVNNLSMLIDFEILVDTFVRYVSHLIVDETSVAIKRRLCLLIESMMENRQYISFRNEMKFRNFLVESIMEWTSDFQKSETSDTTTVNRPRVPHGSFISGKLPEDGGLKKMFVDLDNEVMKALASLLRGLPLDAGDAADSERSKARFARYFGFFTTLLSRNKDSKNETGSLAETTIQCLSNVLASNINSGLQFFVTMGYHEDTATRTAFLKVISNILNQGAEFDQNSEEGDKYDKLVQLLFEPDLALALSVCDSAQITEADDIAALMIRIFEFGDKTMMILKACIAIEIARTESSTGLFRRNSISTKLLAAFSKLMGREYLCNTLAPTIHSIIADNLTFELDPNKLPKGQTMEQNVTNVLKVSQQFMSAIVKSVDDCPLPLREVCHFMHQAVHERFPTFENSAVGGFIFLRFLCPAIISPEGFGVIKDLPNPDVRRGLVLATKSIQNLANGLSFTSDKKEPFMVSMNSFIEDNKKVIAQTLERYATIPPAGVTVVASISDEQREADLKHLHYYISNNLEKIGRLLQTDEPQKGPSTFDRLTNILQKLGPPPETFTSNKDLSLTSISAGKGNDTNMFENFMKTKGNLNTDKIKEKNLFYKHGVSKDKHPVFYLIARKFNPSDPDMEIDNVLLHILKTCHQFWSKPFVLVVDCSLFSAQNMLAVAWANIFTKHFPSGDQLERIIFVNPNQVFKKYSQTIKKFISRNTMKKIHFMSASGLSEFIPDTENGLPSETMATDKDIKVSFSPVLRIQQYSQTNEISVKISGDFLQLQTSKQYQVFGKNTPLLELIPIGNIRSIEHSVEEHEISITYVSGLTEQKVDLRSTSSVQIMERLNASKNLQKLSSGGGVSVRVVNNASDIPGTLLNMALLNLGNEDAMLRLAAYNMLDALCQYFSFSAVSLLRIEGLCIPTHSFHFIVTTSERLAATQHKLTLEFLLECLQGLGLAKASPQLKHLCLDYMRPWFPNLAKFYHLSADPGSAAQVAKTKQVIDSLISFTLKDKEIVTWILSTVWETVGTVTEILETVIDCIIEQGLKSGIGSSELETLGAILTTLASQNSVLVSGKVIARVLQLIGSTASTTKESLEAHPAWPSLTVLIRFLFMLSFENLLHVQQYLPELFHIVMTIFSTGATYIRATVHGLLINILHSLYTLKVTPDNKLTALRFHISELSHPRFMLLFGIGGQNVTSFSRPIPPENKKLDKVSLGTVETVGNALYQALSAVSPQNNPIGTTWHARWLGLTAQVAFAANLALQPRGCVTLGVLCKSPLLVTNDLMEQVLVTLKEALRETISRGDDELAVSLIMCLTNTYEHLTPSSPYFASLFWVAISIVKISDVKLFNAAMGFLEKIIRVLDYHEQFKKGIEEVFNKAREGPIDQIFLKLDSISGLSFRSSFSFGISSHLLKGLKEPRTKESTTRVLSSFLDIAAKGPVGTNILGYLAALLPVEGDLPILKDLNITAGGKHLYQYYFTEQLVPDLKHAALLFTFLVTILRNTKKEYEQQFIYDTLKEGVKFNPEAFCVAEKDLMLFMKETVLKVSEKASLLESAYKIMEALWHFKSLSTGNHKGTSYLNEIGYPKMSDCASWEIDPDMKREITKLVIVLLENLLAEVQNARRM